MTIPPGEDAGSKYFQTVSHPSFAHASPEEKINAIIGIRSPHDPRFLSLFMEKHVKLVSFTRRSPTTASAVFKFKVDRFYCNSADNLHGGAQSLIFDMLTSIAFSGAGVKGGHVSRSLDVTYLRPAPIGTEVLCEVEVMSAGKSMSLLRGVMKRAEDGAVISTCEHDKAMVPYLPGSGATKL